MTSVERGKGGYREIKEIREVKEVREFKEFRENLRECVSSLISAHTPSPYGYSLYLRGRVFI